MFRIDDVINDGIGVGKLSKNIFEEFLCLINMCENVMYDVSFPKNVGVAL